MLSRLIPSLMESKPVDRHPVRMLPDLYNICSAYPVYDHGVNTDNSCNNLDSVHVGAGSFGNLGTASRSASREGIEIISGMGMLSHSTVCNDVFGIPFQMFPQTASSEGDLLSDRAFLDTRTTSTSYSLNLTSHSSSRSCTMLQNSGHSEVNLIGHHKFLENKEYVCPMSFPLSMEHSGGLVTLVSYNNEYGCLSPLPLPLDDREELQNSKARTSPELCYKVPEKSYSMSSMDRLETTDHNSLQYQPHFLGGQNLDKWNTSCKWTSQNQPNICASKQRTEEVTQLSRPECSCLPQLVEADFIREWSDVPRVDNFRPKMYLSNKLPLDVGNLKAKSVRTPYGESSSVVDENTQPPSKRIRSENQPLSVNRFSDLLQVLDLNTRTSSPSEECVEGPGCKRENEGRTETDQLNYVKGRINHLLSTNNHFDDLQRVKCTHDFVLSEELKSGSNSHMTSHGNACELERGTDNCQALDSAINAVSLKKPDLVQEETKIIANPGELGFSGEGKTIETSTGTNLEDLVSLIECFTANQIKEHMLSLNQSKGQHIWMSGVKKMENPVSIGGNTCQLCFMDKHVFKPVPMFCACCDACIKPYAVFYSALDEMGRKNCFCNGCYKGSRGRNIAYQGGSVSKSQLQKGKNNEENEEPWVQCDKCGSWQHQICALYNTLADADGKARYLCPFCLLDRRKLGECMPLPVAFGAKDIPSTTLSDHIEQRLFRQLNKDREDRAKKSGRSVDEEPKAENLVVRVVLSSEKQLKVNHEFRSLFLHEDYPAEFLYESKVIMLFQKIEGVDVCLFSMYVQEFGPECAHPNQRSLYISYLDSVKYFKPEIKAASGEALRTYVYQEILIGYLDYCKKQGFVTCYIWVCPPAKCDNYILYCHPESQKIPNTDKLRQWYKSMLRKSVKEDIVLDCTNFYNEFFIQNDEHAKITAARLPYFDGDYWSGVAEKIVRDMEKQKGGESETKVKKTVTKRTVRAMGHSDITADATKDILVMQKLGQILLHCKEDFLVVRLLATCMKCQEVITSGGYWSCNQCKSFNLCSRCDDRNPTLNKTRTHVFAYGEEHILSQKMMNNIPVDPERRQVALDNDLFRDRLSFLNFCQKNHYQFDTLRRAKHSSMMMLYHLKARCGFQHPTQHLKLYQVLLEVLVHASRCPGANRCSSVACVKMKKLFCHTNKCSKKASGGCNGCVKSWMLLYHHARRCKDLGCRVPRCGEIKEKLMKKIHLKRKANIKELDKG